MRSRNHKLGQILINLLQNKGYRGKKAVKYKFKKTSTPKMKTYILTNSKKLQQMEV